MSELINGYRVLPATIEHPRKAEILSVEDFDKKKSKCKHLSDAGCIDVDDVASDVFEGQVAVYPAGIENDLSHEEQEDGFGDYGWESKTEI